MSKLRAPIRELMDDRLPEPEVQRLWRGVERRVRPRATSSLVRPLMAAAALLVLGVAGWLSLRTSRAPGPVAIDGAGTLSPNRVLQGDEATAWPLSDGSRIQLAADSRLQVLENDDHAFTLRLDSGRGEFDVKPGGPRRWRIESGDVRVEVVGTRFSVGRDARGVSVQVRHGIVRVRSARIAGGERRLAAGERLDLPFDPPPTAAAGGNALPAAARDDSQPSAATTPAKDAARPSNDDARTAAAGAVKTRAPAASAPAPVAREAERGDPNALLRKADEARRQGRIAHAEALLERVRMSWPGTSPAALASLTLARMRIAAAPEVAARDLTAALAAELPQGLREDAMARLVEAHARAGQREPAARAADAYRRAYPGGRRTAEVERWTPLP